MPTKLIIIIPALNEARTLKGVIRAIPSEIPGVDTTEVIVVDDGSTDTTPREAHDTGAVVVSHAHSMGVGAAFHTGIRNALQRGADIIVNMDADAQFDPADIPALIAPITRGNAQFVTASRFARKEFEPEMPLMKRLGNAWMTRLINVITGKRFSDVSCGFRAYARDAAMRMTLFGHFTYTQETFIDLAFKHVPMAEVPIKVRGEREHGSSRVASNLWRYGVKSASIIFRAARDYRPFVFIGLPGTILLVGGAIAGIFVLWHFAQTGQTSPYRSLVPGSGILIIVGVLLLIISFVADMLYRNRMLLDQILYFERKREYNKNVQES